MSAGAPAVPTRGASSRWRTWILSAIIVLLLIALAISRAITASLNNVRPYDFNSLQPMGLRALQQSLGEMGYTVVDLRGAEFTLPEEGDLLLTWPGEEPWSTQEVQALRAWAENGRTAAVFASATDYQYAFDAWGAEPYSGFESGFGNEIVQVQPLLPESPATISDDSAYVSYEFTENIVPATMIDETGWRGTAGVESIGKGALWYLTDAHDMTNANLADPRRTAILAALLRLVPAGGTVVFDGYHLYGPEIPEGEAMPARTIQDWLYRDPLGRAALFALIVGLVGLVMAGRRLGPPLKSARELKRREGAEYVRALAGLKRRAHAGEEIAARQRLRLKSALGKPRHIAAALDDAAFIAALRAAGDLDSGSIAQVDALLKRLQSVADEKALVSAAAAVDELLASLA